MRHEADLEAHLGRAVRELRQVRGWSQEQLAAEMRERGYQLHQTQVAKSENGARPIRLNEAAAFADALGVTLVDLVRWSPGQPDGEHAARVHTLRATHENLRAVARGMADEVQLRKGQLDMALSKQKWAEERAAEIERELSAAEREYVDDLRSGDRG